MLCAHSISRSLFMSAWKRRVQIVRGPSYPRAHCSTSLEEKCCWHLRGFILFAFGVKLLILQEWKHWDIERTRSREQIYSQQIKRDMLFLGSYTTLSHKPSQPSVVFFIETVITRPNRETTWKLSWLLLLKRRGLVSSLQNDPATSKISFFQWYTSL